VTQPYVPQRALATTRPHTGDVAQDKSTVVTTAGLSGTDDRRLRQRRYAITQACRLSCFILAVALPLPLWGKLVFIVGAFVLPWMGVMAANGGPAVQKNRENAIVDRVEPLRIAIEPGRTIDQD
jgi:hypothetical protein